MNKRNLFIAFVLVFTVTLSSFSFYIYQVLSAPNILVQQESRYIYIPSDASFRDVQNILYDGNYVNDPISFSFLSKLMKYDRLVKPGKYLLDAEMSNRDAIRLLRSGQQAPTNITFNNVRLLQDLPE